jgi:hypothetical protein
MIDSNLKEVNTYKTKGIVYGKEEEVFIEINLYEKDPTQNSNYQC